MADPVTLAGASMASSAASAGIGAFASLQKGKAQQGMYNYQGGIARANQRIQEQNADFALEGGSREEVAMGIKQGAERGKLITALGASGLNVNTGTPAALRDSLDTVHAMDRDNQRRNLLQKVRGYKLAAWEQGAQAKLYDTAAINAKKAGQVDALRSLVGGAESVSDKWLKMSQVMG